MNKKTQNSSSQEQISYESVNRLSKDKEAKQNRGKIRYKTETDEEQVQVVSNSSKKPAFKRAHNELILKDKTFIGGYLSGKQLGRGGFSKVW